MFKGSLHCVSVGAPVDFLNILNRWWSNLKRYHLLRGQHWPLMNFNMHTVYFTCQKHYDIFPLQQHEQWPTQHQLWHRNISAWQNRRLNYSTHSIAVNYSGRRRRRRSILTTKRGWQSQHSPERAGRARPSFLLTLRFSFNEDPPPSPPTCRLPVQPFSSKTRALSNLKPHYNWIYISWWTSGSFWMACRDLQLDYSEAVTCIPKSDFTTWHKYILTKSCSCSLTDYLVCLTCHVR